MPPLGIAMLAASLREAGYPANLLDIPGEGMSDSDTIAYLTSNRFEHIGFSANVFAVDNAIRLARMVKEKYPQTVTSLGGPCTVFATEQILKYADCFDLIVGGEGEQVVVDIARAIEAGETPTDVAGTVFVSADGMKTNPEAKPLIMDELPRPALDLLPVSSYRLHPPFGAYPPALIVETARGCPFRCTFCTLPKNIRMRSAELVVEDVSRLVKDYNLREIHFVDPTFTFNRERTLAIAEGLIRADLNIHWTCKTRCDLVDQEMLEVMAKSGCYTISYGVESATQSVLDSLKKDVTVEQIYSSLRETKAAGIRTLAYMLIGAPGETDETIETMIGMVRELKPDYALYGELLPDPCSEITDAAIAKGIFDESKLLDYYLGGEKELLEDASMLGFPADQIDGWISRASNSFYMRPSYILDRLRDVRSTADFLNLFRGGWHLLIDKLGVSSTVG
jgi:radical SAM superfamily enzyme YgiQ (UPF0313 family)